MKLDRNILTFGIFLFAWLGIELVLVLTGALPDTQPATGANIALGVGIALVLTFALPWLRRAAWNVPLQLLLGLQAIRFFGVMFLVYSGEGLDPVWALAAGWGDIAVAAAAHYAEWRRCPPHTAARRMALWGWSGVVIVDILAAPASAITLRAVYPGTMPAILQWPLRIVPLYFVPLMIYLHALIVVRLVWKTKVLDKRQSSEPPLESAVFSR